MFTGARDVFAGAACADDLRRTHTRMRLACSQVHMTRSRVRWALLVGA
jgi:hypothetical protein